MSRFSELVQAAVCSINEVRSVRYRTDDPVSVFQNLQDGLSGCDATRSDHAREWWGGLRRLPGDQGCASTCESGFEPAPSRTLRTRGGVQQIEVRRAAKNVPLEPARRLAPDSEAFITWIPDARP
jgi:hypothetical protein